MLPVASVGLLDGSRIVPSCSTLLVDRHIDMMIALMCDEESAATGHCSHTVEEKDGLFDLVNCSGVAHPTDWYVIFKTIFLFCTDIKYDKQYTKF